MEREEINKILADRFEGFELVEYLQISAEDVLLAFEDVIDENLEDLLEFAGIKND